MEKHCCNIVQPGCQQRRLCTYLPLAHFAVELVALLPLFIYYSLQGLGVNLHRQLGSASFQYTQRKYWDQTANLTHEKACLTTGGKTDRVQIYFYQTRWQWKDKPWWFWWALLMFDFNKVSFMVTEQSWVRSKKFSLNSKWEDIGLDSSMEQLFFSLLIQLYVLSLKSKQNKVSQVWDTLTEGWRLSDCLSPLEEQRAFTRQIEAEGRWLTS